MITLEEAKTYLRVDSSDDDALIQNLTTSAEEMVMDVGRHSSLDSDTERVAVLYALGYMYEHREEADYHALTLTLRSLLFGVREVVF